MQVLENLWYCSALSTEVNRKPMRRVICGMPVVFYRTEAGEPVALEDRCSHRQAPLSMGEVIGDEIQCSYHGYVFCKTGACTHIPHQSVVPSLASIKAFTAVERWGFIWIWWGDAQSADPSSIPDLSWTEDPERRPVYLYFHANANHQLVADNLLDVSHADFLHGDTIGSKTGKKEYEAPSTMSMETETVGDQVRSVRRLVNVDIGRIAQNWGKFTKKVNRVNTQMWEPPNTVHIRLEFMNDENHSVINHDHIMTPESETSTHYFMDWTRNFSLDGAYLTDEDVFREQTMIIGGEDIPMIEAQQENVALYASLRDVPAKADKLVNDVHRLLRDIYKREGIEAPGEVRRTG
jgi:phenylpropionate dioxygenase-like ring-hydroxylating dioxygenase large terminal subunit